MENGKKEFDIPFNRQQLADSLNLDRSALSKELCKMRDEGLLEFDKNRFVLKQLPE
jgi:Mn-dependent DtxR family transcriptional regulator